MDYFSELYLAFIEVSERRNEIMEIIHDRDRFTDAFRLDPKIRPIGIYAISFDGKAIEYLAIGKKSGRVATYVDRVNFSDFLDVNILTELVENSGSWGKDLIFEMNKYGITMKKVRNSNNNSKHRPKLLMDKILEAYR